MNIYSKTHLVFLLATLVLLLHIAPAQGQAGTQYTLVGGIISSGGGTQSGGPYSVDGSMGQAVIVPATGDNYTVTDVFWVNEVNEPPLERKAYLPVVTR